ncbi:hypothetical protein HK096_007194 [Nowakowskiella sp. JEL0078]|nr:hypothetical protein HK096_007194 [Nowakowskiella sp. JEL0078]
MSQQYAQVAHKTGSLNGRRKWAEYGMKKQLLIVGSATTVLSMSVVLALSLAFLGSITNNIIGSSFDVMSSQIESILTASVEDSAALFEDDLNKFGLSVALLTRTATGDTFRVDQPLASVTSYFANENGLNAAGINIPSRGSTDSRHLGESISLAHSTFMIANYSDNATPTLDSNFQTFVDATSHLDIFFRNIYSIFPETISIYSGFSNGIFRTFPGIKIGKYDPTHRPWYLDAINNPKSPFVITDPYNDAFGQGWMITFSSIIRNTSSGEQIGVAGADVTISTLRSKLQELSVQNGTLSLYLLTGQALSTPNWDLDPSKPSPSYKDAVYPTISEDLWNQMIKNTVTGKANSINYFDPKSNSSEQYLLTYMTLNITNGKSKFSYLAFAAFPKSKISYSIQDVRSNMQTILGIFGGISVAIFFVIVAIVVTSVIALASAAAKPLVNLSQVSENISKNLVKEDIFEGIEMKNAGVRNRRFMVVDETERLSTKFYDMIKTLRDSGTTNSGTVAQEGNIFFNNQNLPPWNAASQPDSVVNSVPDIPPSYDDIPGKRSSNAGPSNSNRN